MDLASRLAVTMTNDVLTRTKTMLSGLIAWACPYAPVVRCHVVSISVMSILSSWLLHGVERSGEG